MKHVLVVHGLWFVSGDEKYQSIARKTAYSDISTVAACLANISEILTHVISVSTS